MSDKQFECAIESCDYSANTLKSLKNHKSLKHPEHGKAYTADKLAKANFECQYCG